MRKVGIIGATGYAGLEIARLLMPHPDVELEALSSVSFTGQALPDVYPAMRHLLEKTLEDDSAVVERSDIVFASLPHGLSEEIAAKCDKAGKLFIDMGADFRLDNEADYRQWYGGDYADKTLHQKAVYGLPELFRDKVKGAKLIANPGCYPTSVALALAPLLEQGALDLSSIIIDAKSGVTGAGRGLSQTTHYPDVNEAFAPYKIAQHRHTPEIEQTLSTLSGEAVKITFVPHLLPVNRGILSTIYATPTDPKYCDIDALHALYQDRYYSEYFVRVLPAGGVASIRQVQLSNFCNISLHADPRTGRIVVVSAIDNMVKGAAGQAIQNMNIACGFEEQTALDLVPPSF